MPVYEYKCTSCGAREEHILLASESAPTACAVCGGPLKRAWSGRIHVSLEGWGFSKTDSLVRGEGRGKDFKKLKERADRIRDE
ncbi:MAG: FmdB family zinc ribbon protein [Actinomycetota bacterium]